MPASTLGGEAWIPLIGSPGNMQVSGSKGPEQLAVEVAEACGGGAQLSLLWPLTLLWPADYRVREPERKDLTFSFPRGFERNVFC